MISLRLYSYCVKHDSGAAPNPFWGICTLVICKPVIRRTASIGDWVVGFGSKNSPIGDIFDKIVYAMKVTSVLTLQEYDQLCRDKHPKKIPDWFSKDFRKKVGDCIYDFSKGEVLNIRLGVHSEINRQRDLGGKNALLSKHFFYFGDKPIAIPKELEPIIHYTQGHKSTSNDPYTSAFEKWIEGTEYKKNHIYGDPQLKAKFESDPDFGKKCSQIDLQEDETDEKC